MRLTSFTDDGLRMLMRIAGGATLARSADGIRPGDVVRLPEEDQALARCAGPDGGLCRIDGRCRPKRRLRAAEERGLDELDRSCLSDTGIEFVPVH